MQDGLLAIDHEGVAGVVSALMPNDEIGLAGEEIDNFAFPLVAPLRADDRHVRHDLNPLLYIRLRCLFEGDDTLVGQKVSTTETTRGGLEMFVS